VLANRALHRVARFAALRLALGAGMPAVPSESPFCAANCWTCGIAEAAAEVQRSAAPGADRLLDCCAGGPPVGAERSVIGCWVSHGTLG
jgi:hypothetical protein